MFYAKDKISTITVCLSINLSIYQSVYPSICLSFYLPSKLSICLPGKESITSGMISGSGCILGFCATALSSSATMSSPGREESSRYKDRKSRWIRTDIKIDIYFYFHSILILFYLSVLMVI